MLAPALMTTLVAGWGQPGWLVLGGAVRHRHAAGAAGHALGARHAARAQRRRPDAMTQRCSTVSPSPGAAPSRRSEGSSPAEGARRAVPSRRSEGSSPAEGARRAVPSRRSEGSSPAEVRRAAPSRPADRSPAEELRHAACIPRRRAAVGLRAQRGEDPLARRVRGGGALQPRQRGQPLAPLGADRASPARGERVQQLVLLERARVARVAQALELVVARAGLPASLTMSITATMPPGAPRAPSRRRPAPASSM